MKTLGRHWPTRLPGGDRQARCDYCGNMTRRSLLQVNSQGLLYCSCSTVDDDIAAISEENAARAAPPAPIPNPGGATDGHPYVNPIPGWHIPAPEGAPTNYTPWLPEGVP